MLRELKFQAHLPLSWWRVAHQGDCRTDSVRRVARCFGGFFVFAKEVLYAASRARLERYACHIESWRAHIQTSGGWLPWRTTHVETWNAYTELLWSIMLLDVVLTLSRHAPGTSSSRRSRRPTPAGQTTWTAPRCSWRRRLRLRQSWPTTALVVSRWLSKTLCVQQRRSRISRAEDEEKNAPGHPLQVLHHGLPNNVPTPRVRARRRMRTPMQLTVSSSETRVALTSAGPGTHRSAVAWSVARQGGRKLANGAGRLNTDCVVANGRNLLGDGRPPAASRRSGHEKSTT